MGRLRHNIWPMLITIAIPAFNEEELLPSTLATVAEAGEAFTERGWETEVVVCDNNSTDRTAEIAEAAGARVVFEEHNQKSLARNAAGNAAKGEWIIFLDADSKPSKALFEATAMAMDKKEIIGGGTTIKIEGRHGKEEERVCWDSSLAFLERNLNVFSRVLRCPTSQYNFLRTEDFHGLNGFSKKHYATEELEFGRRLKKLGKQRRQRVQIFTQTPLSTSDRKCYGACPAKRQMKMFLLWVFTVGRSVRKIENCGYWYNVRGVKP